jgi:hypothetical protein
MKRPKIVEEDYQLFMKKLRTATNNGQRIEKTDQPAWDDFVRENNINEVVMASWGKTKFEKTVPVIINDGSSWEGYYVYSQIDEACLKWIRPEDQT